LSISAYEAHQNRAVHSSTIAQEIVAGEMIARLAIETEDRTSSSKEHPIRVKSSRFGLNTAENGARHISGEH